MFGKKKEDEFFTMFREYATAIQQMGEVFGTVLKEYEGADADSEIPAGEASASEASAADPITRLKEMESECDTMIHQILDKLNASFVTPFDREDIFVMVRQMDDVADFIEDTASKLRIYNVQSMQEDAMEMGNILVESTEQIKVLFDLLPDNKKMEETKVAIRRINHLENAGDAVHRQALSRLFREETNAVELVRWKDIYDLLDDTLDACEHLADTVKGVITKNA